MPAEEDGEGVCPSFTGYYDYSVVAMATQWFLWLLSPTAVSGVLHSNITDSNRKPILATRGFLVSWYMS